MAWRFAASWALGVLSLLVFGMARSASGADAGVVCWAARAG